MAYKQVLILGEHDPGHDAHVAIADALRDASDRAGAVVNTRWLGGDDLAERPGLVAEADGVVLAPRGPRAHRVFPAPVVAALRTVRERRIPFLGLGDAHELVLIELARNVLGMAGAGSTYYDDDLKDPVVKELPEPRSGRRPRLLDVAIRDDAVLGPYLPRGRREEPARLTHGVNADYAVALEEAGLRVAGTDVLTQRPCLWALEGAPWHVTAAFLPQLGGRPGAPHPLFAGFVAHVVGAA
ncbi:MAG TPA: hypothetical protein VEI02_04635 [Planctomycetota bacterium]|nr:hypothetical protein [Planctomycetota bacterium]